MGFFDFLGAVPPYCDGKAPSRRMNKRHALLIEPFAELISGARVLDIAAHDGRWSYALAAAGAAEVIGVEARAELIGRFALFPDSDFKSKVQLRQGDLHDYLDMAVARGQRFDVVALLGIYYHVMDHFRILRQIHGLGAQIVIVDGEFMHSPQPYIQLVTEKTDQSLNAAPQIAGQTRAIKGVPSTAAMEKMAEAVGYEVTWLDPAEAFGDRKGVQDYFRATRKRRAACVLSRAGA